MFVCVRESVCLCVGERESVYGNRRSVSVRAGTIPSMTHQ